MMRALVWHGPRRMTLERVALPEPGPGEVRVRVEAVGICGSELSGYLGHNALRVPPLVMGHEFAGVVDAVGDAGDDRMPEGPAGDAAGAKEPVPPRGARGGAPAPGARVVVNPLLSCGRCDACRAGRANLCDRRALVGAHRPGAFAEAVVVPAAACLALPDEVDAAAAAMVEPLACAVRATRLAGVGASTRLRVLGAGTIGLLCALVARADGAAEVSIHDPNRARAAVGEDWGLDAPEGAPDRADAVIDAVGLEATRAQAVALLDRGGTAVFVGLHQATARFDGNDVVRDEKVVRGCFAYAPDDFATALELINGGFLPPAGAWRSERPLAAGPAAFDELIDGDPGVIKIVLRPGARGPA